MAKSAPIPATRDWNNEAGRTVATYASNTQPGYAVHVADVDRGGYNPYSRLTHFGSQPTVFRTRTESPA